MLPAAVPIGPMFLGPLMLILVPLWFGWFFLLFRQPHAHAHARTSHARGHRAG